MLGRQIAGGLVGQRLLRAHQDRVREAADEHRQGQGAVHDADALVIDAGDPFPPEIRQVSADHDPGQDAQDEEGDHTGGDEGKRLAEGNGLPGELAQHVYDPPLGRTFGGAPSAFSVGPGPGGTVWSTIP